jgi:hypothetical protein
MARQDYQVVGKASYWGVALPNGLLEYDLLKSQEEAQTIAAVLNEGKGPEWDKIKTEVKRRLETKHDI